LGYATSLADLDSRRGELERAREEHAQGQGGFARAMDLARKQAVLGIEEAAAAHPIAATVLGGALGAGVGATSAPQVQRGLSAAGKIPGQLKRLYGR
jgi:hypothetical protein